MRENKNILVLISGQGTRHRRTAVYKDSVCVLVDESQIPAIGVVNLNGQYRRER